MPENNIHDCMVTSNKRFMTSVHRESGILPIIMLLCMLLCIPGEKHQKLFQAYNYMLVALVLFTCVDPIDTRLGLGLGIGLVLEYYRYS